MTRIFGTSTGLIFKAANKRFERLAGAVFGEPRRASMIGINHLRFASARSRVGRNR